MIKKVIIFYYYNIKTNYLNITKMQVRKLSLASIMNQWDDQEIMLQVQGNRIVTVSNKRSKIKRSQPGIGLFSRMAHGMRMKENREVQGQGQFVIKAKDRNRSYRVSLADLGDAYNTSRVNIRKQRRISQNIPQYEPPKQNIIKSRHTYSNSNLNHPHQQNNSKVDNYSKYQTHNSEKRRPVSQFNCISQNQNNFDHHHQNAQQQKFYPKTTKNKITHTNYGENTNLEKIQQIRQSIQSIRLPTNPTLCPEYSSANQRFQNMKRQILEKIIQSGEINQVSDIIREIRQAADQIIARHYPAQPSLKKPQSGMFSFKDIQLNPIYPNTNNINLTLNKISQEPDDKIQGIINLPQFKDDAGSISSILSLNGNQIKKDDSNQIGNVLIQDAVQNQVFRQDDSVSSIKPIILNQVKIQNDFGEICKQVKEEQKLRETLREQGNTVLQSQANNMASIRKPDEKSLFRESLARPQIQSIVQAPVNLPQPQIQIRQIQPQKKFEQKIQPVQNNFWKKQEPCQAPPIQFEAYDLEKLTSKPVKIIQNLQQAKKFDPEVTKFTELKVQYLETRTRTPQIITIPSPLRFRRKQQVVKHLVATHIVDKQSKSIEY